MSVSLHVGIELSRPVPWNRFFISGGFAIVSADSVASVTAGEAVSVDQLDGEAISRELARFNEEFTKAANDGDKAKAQIGLEVLTAAQNAFTQLK